MCRVAGRLLGLLVKNKTILCSPYHYKKEEVSTGLACKRCSIPDYLCPSIYRSFNLSFFAQT